MFPDQLPLHLLCKYIELRDIHCLRIVCKRFHKECNVEFFREFKRRLNLALEHEDIPLPINYLDGEVVMVGGSIDDVLHDLTQSKYVVRLVYPNLNANTVDNIITGDSRYTMCIHDTACTLYYKNRYILLIQTSICGDPLGGQYNGKVLTIKRGYWKNVS